MNEDIYYELIELRDDYQISFLYFSDLGKLAFLFCLTTTLSIYSQTSSERYCSAERNSSTTIQSFRKDFIDNDSCKVTIYSWVP